MLIIWDIKTELHWTNLHGIRTKRSLRCTSSAPEEMQGKPTCRKRVWIWHFVFITYMGQKQEKTKQPPPQNQTTKPLQMSNRNKCPNPEIVRGVSGIWVCVRAQNHQYCVRYYYRSWKVTEWRSEALPPHLPKFSLRWPNFYQCLL